MKTLNLEIDLSFIKEEPKPNLIKTWEGFIMNGLRTTYRDGIDFSLQRKLEKIFNKLEVSIGTLELEDAEFDVLKDIKDRSKFDPSLYKTTIQCNQRIEEAK